MSATFYYSEDDPTIFPILPSNQIHGSHQNQQIENFQKIKKKIQSNTYHILTLMVLRDFTPYGSKAPLVQIQVDSHCLKPNQISYIPHFVFMRLNYKSYLLNLICFQFNPLILCFLILIFYYYITDYFKNFFFFFFLRKMYVTKTKLIR